MSVKRGGEVVHECVGGFCRVCGDTVEWLRDRGRDRVIECVGHVDAEIEGLFP